MILEHELNWVYPLQQGIQNLNLTGRKPIYIPAEFHEFADLYNEYYISENASISNTKYYDFALMKTIYFDYFYYLFCIHKISDKTISYKHNGDINDNNREDVSIRIVGMFGKFKERDLNWMKSWVFSDLYHNFIKNKDIYFSELNTNGIFIIQYENVDSVCCLNLN